MRVVDAIDRGVQSGARDASEAGASLLSSPPLSFEEETNVLAAAQTMKGRTFVVNSINIGCLTPDHKERCETIIKNINANIIDPINTLARKDGQAWRETLKIKTGKRGYIESVHKLPFVEIDAMSNPGDVLAQVKVNEQNLIAVKNLVTLTKAIAGARSTWPESIALVTDLWMNVPDRANRACSVFTVSEASVGFTLVDFARPSARLSKLLPDGLEGTLPFLLPLLSSNEN